MDKDELIASLARDRTALLEALEALTYWYDKANRDGLVLAGGIDKARAAIALAKGDKS